ncbi:MAG: carboxyl transferase [Ruminococcus sp.]|nr:carboxyl transferase [Ruminococcus sp.]
MAEFSNPAELAAAAAAASDAKTRLTYLFDEGRYTELDAYASNGDKLSGVVTAYGYTDGNPCYAFSQDVSVNKGALNKAQADKIAKIYDLAAKTGVPVVGIYDSCGADLSDGQQALTAYGELLLCMSNLSGVVPQIAVVAGVCSGTSALMAESADFVVMAKNGELYSAPNADIESSSENALMNGTAALGAETDKEAVEAAKQLLSRLPMNNLSPIPMYEFEQPAAADKTPEAIADKGSLCELYAEYGKASYTALATLGGATVGIVATNKAAAKLNCRDCTKIARFVRFCDAFAVPVITLVDTEGFEGSTETETMGAVKSMAKLAHAYAEATTAKISVVTGRAYGAAFIALAGKGANADLSYATDDAVITALDPITAAEFFYHDELKGAGDLKDKRASLAARYAVEEGSPVIAAAKGCIDGVVTAASLRDTLISAVEILAGKRVSRLPKKHSNIQL